MKPAGTYVRPILDAVRAVADTDRRAAQARAHRDLLIARALDAGMTLEQAANVSGLSYAMVRVIARRHGATLRPGRRPTPRVR